MQGSYIKVMVSKVCNLDNDGSSCVRIQEPNSNLVDSMRLFQLLLNAASHVIPSDCKTEEQ